MPEIVDNTEIVSKQNRIKVKIGDYDLLDSKTIQVSTEFPVTIFIEDLTIKFIFDEDEMVGPNNIKSKVIKEEKMITFTLTNWKSPTPLAVVKPALFGTMYNRKAYIYYNVATLVGDAKIRVMNYNILLGDSI